MVAEGAADGLSVRAVKRPRRIVAAVRREESMTRPRSSRQLIKTWIKMWHRRANAAVDHAAGPMGDPKGAAGTTHSAFTPSGLAVEDQVRKAWRPSSAGLAIF
jgi:hypothetical protein